MLLLETLEQHGNRGNTKKIGDCTKRRRVHETSKRPHR